MPGPTTTLQLALTPELEFILDLGVAIALALVGGVIAARLRQPPIVGYLAAGVVIGPFTPGFVGRVEQISQLAELGVVRLLFAGRRVLAARAREGAVDRRARDGRAGGGRARGSACRARACEPS